MNRKKALFIVLPLIFIMIGLFFAIFFNVGRLTYTYSDVYDGYLVKRAYGNEKEYVIPKKYRNKDIVGVSTRAFYKHSKLEKITFKDNTNISYIGRLAFSECKKLKSINLEYIEVIDKGAFSYDISLKELKIGAKYIGGSAFYKCKKLEDVVLLYGVISIGTFSFAECSNLFTLTIPESCNEIGVNAFSYSGLNTLYVPRKFEDDTYLLSLDCVIYY